MKKQIKIDPHLKRWYKWRDKITNLSKQILELKTEGEPAVIAISKFLLTTQLVEFQLRELLLTLGFNAWLKSGKNYISDPAIFDKKQYTLGMLVNKELTKYTSTIGVKLLIRRLKTLLRQRNQFVHRLFSSHLPADKLQPLSLKGSTLGEQILFSLAEIERSSNDKQDKYFTRIKKLKNPSEKENLLLQIWIGKVQG